MYDSIRAKSGTFANSFTLPFGCIFSASSLNNPQFYRQWALLLECCSPQFYRQWALIRILFTLEGWNWDLFLSSIFSTISKITPSPPPQMSLLKEEYCVVLCEMELNHKQVRAFSQKIDEDYTLHM